MVTLTRHLPADPNATVSFTLPLTALERTRSRCRLDIASGDVVYLHLPRGTVLRDRDLLQSEDGACLVRVIAKPEPVLTVIAPHPLLLLRSVYHLGNRHIPVEIAETYVRLSPDPVLQTLLEKMGLAVKAEIAPFQPETGAYGHNH